MSEEKKCPICEDWCGPKSKEIARKRAAKTAHKLASDQADVGYAGLEWEEVYGVFFAKIYKHEFERNLKVEIEIELEESVKRNKRHPDVCEYHWDNIAWLQDGTHKKTMKDLWARYHKSKWPNKLAYY